MINLVEQTLLEYIPIKHHKSSSGWISFSGPCCVHNGETRDTRGRAGVIINNNVITYSCFNCRFKTSYRYGGKFGYKFRKLLSWFGVDENTLSLLQIESLRAATNSQGNIEYKHKEILIQEIDLPKNSFLLSEVENDFKEHADYIRSRGFSLDSYPFYVSTHLAANMKHRVILPFIRNNKLVGYTARAINKINPKYYMQLSCPYVFGADLQKHDWTWTILSEGPFDALSINGLSIMGNEISDDQAELIDELGMRIIVVPQADIASNYLIDAALKYKWEVSFPEWDVGVKDLNEAVNKYSRLVVTRQILQSATNNPTKIQLLKKFR